MTAKNCTKKCDARWEVVVLVIEPFEYFDVPVSVPVGLLNFLISS